MERFAFVDLLKWKKSKTRKPLILQGARQVGKTWLMKEFGRSEYEQVAYINFESSDSLKSIFTEDFDVNRLITAFQIETGIRIRSENTLIILDEIQEAERGITSLKYFCENAPEYHIIAAGSLLGITLHQKTSFPVGKVDFLTLYPMSFTEFLLALGQEQLYELLESQDWAMITSFKAKLTGHLRHYYFIGGMPEAVSSFISENDFDRVRTIQKNILSAYEHDFSKHAPAEIVPRIKMLWQSIPSQLAKENKKFIFGVVKQGGRAKEFELALAWLTDCGLVHKIQRVSKAAIPLVAYQDSSAFKLYILDVGLLSAMGGLTKQTILQGNSIFSEFKGALAEQFVLQHLKTRQNVQVFYWSSDTSRGELDFVIQANDRVIPIEVKAAENLKAKSLKFFFEKFNPTMSVRTSMSDYRKESWLTNVPLYAFDSFLFETAFV
ncbi:MAG: ATP-binding protein [Bacteroidetes bacterium]|nr:ATP-binding protein [Bacteroidota bacterium]